MADAAPDASTMVVAIGGNSLILDAAHQQVEDQYNALLGTMGAVLALLDAGHKVVLTHGNGPQVGYILRRSELARHELHEVPLPSCVADTQGAIGYQIQRAMATLQHDRPRALPTATVVTQTLVDADDPAFAQPTKPIGSFLDRDTAMARRAAGWAVAEDTRGWRRVVASPRPIEIVEFDAIRHLVGDGFLVVAVGGGGIPVVRQADGSLIGADAVIDKDFASSLLARKLPATWLVICTAVPKACLNFGTPDEKPLDVMTVAEARSYLDEGHFGSGSMGPKVEASIEFVEATGGTAVITDPAHLADVTEEGTGTRIVPDP
jgi:carbamate kinase